jgi:sugar/nucleoside kinase (ribokinase family)
VEIACAAVAAGGRVELVGSVGDDPLGDAVVVGLGRAGVGHAALLRDPGAPTPLAGRLSRGSRGAGAPRLDRADVELGLGYLADWGVLVLAEALPPEVEAAALDAAAFHRAQVVAVVSPGATVSERLSRAATVLEGPRGPSEAFARTVGQFAT